MEDDETISKLHYQVNLLIVLCSSLLNGHSESRAAEIVSN